MFGSGGASVPAGDPLGDRRKHVRESSELGGHVEPKAVHSALGYITPNDKMQLLAAAQALERMQMGEAQSDCLP
jgi:hypothetical protein